MLSYFSKKNSHRFLCISLWLFSLSSLSSLSSSHNLIYLTFCSSILIGFLCAWTFVSLFVISSRSHEIIQFKIDLDFVKFKLVFIFIVYDITNILLSSNIIMRFYLVYNNELLFIKTE